jgi:hypothetical protein
MLISLKQIIMGGDARRVLVNPEAIYYVSNEDGTGSIVSTMIGTIRVMETPEQIREKVSSATLKAKHGDA